MIGPTAAEIGTRNPPIAYTRPVLARLGEYVSAFTGFQSTDDAMIVILGASMVYVTIGIWIVDGRPGLAPIRWLLERSFFGAEILDGGTFLNCRQHIPFLLSMLKLPQVNPV